MESRKRIDMSSGEFAWTTLSVLGLGVLAGWALFGRPNGVGALMKSGNLAEWVAAVSALAIGYGALSYAKLGHQLRLDEINANRKKEVETLLNTWSLMIYKAVQGFFPESTIHIYDTGEGVRTQQHCRSTLQRMIRDLNRIEWTDAQRTLMSSTTGMHYQHFEIRKAAVVARAEQLVDMLTPDSQAELSELALLSFGDLREQATQLKLTSEKLKEEFLKAVGNVRYVPLSK